MVITKKNEEAVSPVIGVILMVAITVILAAVIAAFVFGMAGNIQKTKVVAATEKRNSSAFVIVTYQGGQDAGTLGGIAFTVDGVNATVNGGAGTYGTIIVPASPAQNSIVPATGTVLPIGANVAISATSPGKNHVVGIGLFTDGTNQVIVDTTL